MYILFIYINKTQQSSFRAGLLEVPGISGRLFKNLFANKLILL